MPPKSSTASIQPVNFFCFVRGGAVNQEIPGDISVPDSTWPPNQQNWNQNFFSTPFDFHQKVARQEFSSTEWEVSLTQKTRNIAVSGVFHCHQYHFNQIKSLLYSLSSPLEMDAWMARNCCLLKKSWNEGCHRVFILAGNGLRWNTLDIEQIKEDHWGGTYSCQACHPMAQLLGMYEKLLRSDEAVMRGKWCSSLREWAWKL